MQKRDDVTVFESARPRLLGLAYRILGSRADAEDAVQDTFLKWQASAADDIETPAAWLTTVCTRRCLDMLRAAHRSRVDYVGTWLPEPIRTSIENEVESRQILASSLTTAFLLMLERLTPRERAAYLLRNIFDVSYPEIGATLDIQESACRKLVSRASANIEQVKIRHVTPAALQDQLLAEFQAAIESGTPENLAALLSDDIRLSADGGGKVPAILDVLHGKAAVLNFLVKGLHRFWDQFHWTGAEINSQRGIVLQQDGKTMATVSFAYDEAGRSTDIYIMRNPGKLEFLASDTIH